MKIKFSLEHQDFLTQQLYRITRDKVLQVKRQKQWIILPIVSLVIAAYFYFSDLITVAIVMVFYAILSFLFYRKYFDFRYKSHFDSFVSKNYAKRIGIESSVEFLPKFILAKDRTGESKLNNDQVDFIADLPDHFLLHLKVEEVIIIPKKQIDPVSLKQKFEDLGFVIVDESNWRWGQAKYL